MSFNRTLYDLEKRLWDRDAIVGEGKYRLYEGNATNNKRRYSSYGVVGSKSDVSRMDPSVDKFSISAENKLNRQFNNSHFKPVKTINKKSTNVYMNEDIDLHPLEEYRGLTTFGHVITPYLFIDPQKNIIKHDSAFGMNTKLFTKDNFVPQYPKFLDKYDALPCKKILKVKN